MARNIKEEGNRQLAAGHYEQALELYDTALSAASDDAQTRLACYLNKSLCLMRMAQLADTAMPLYSAAKTALHAARAIDPTNVKANYRLAAVLLQSRCTNKSELEQCMLALDAACRQYSTAGELLEIRDKFRTWKAMIMMEMDTGKRAVEPVSASSSAVPRAGSTVGSAAAATGSKSLLKPPVRCESFASHLVRAVEFGHSPDGVDENLLICFHGLGDTEAGLANMARGMQLPQTAWVSLRGPHSLPQGMGVGFTWCDDAVDDGFNLVDTGAHPRFRAFMANLHATSYLLMRALLSAATGCGYAPSRVHLLGHGLGGTLALHIAKQGYFSGELPLCSVISCGGGYLGEVSAVDSTFSASTPGLGEATAEDAALSNDTVWMHVALPEALGRAASLQTTRSAFNTLSHKRGKHLVFSDSVAAGMPRNKAEMTPLMKVWGQALTRRLEAYWLGPKLTHHL